MERVGVRELDLSNCGPGSVAERVAVVPGLRSSAGKFCTLPVQVFVYSMVLLPSLFSRFSLRPFPLRLLHFSSHCFSCG